MAVRTGGLRGPWRFYVASINGESIQKMKFIFSYTLSKLKNKTKHCFPESITTKSKGKFGHAAYKA